MRIYLDGMFYRRSGIGRLFEDLLEAFSTHPGIERIHTAVPARHKSRFLAQFGRPSVLPAFVGYEPMSAGDLLRKSALLRGLRGSVRLFLFPGPNVPVSVPGKYIPVVHDVSALTDPDSAPWSRKAMCRRALVRAVRGTEDVIAVSATTRRELEREAGIPGENIQVIYPRVRDGFFGAPPEGGSPVAGEYILFAGLRSARKNVEGILRAFTILGEGFPGMGLVIAGARCSTPDGVDRWKAESRFRERVAEVPDPSDEDLRRLFLGARVFVFPSFSEGFGLPPLEAMAAGVPVVCSDIPVFREVYGVAARFVDPASPDSIARGVRELLSDTALAEILVKKGRERAALFRGEKSIRKFLDLIEV